MDGPPLASLSLTHVHYNPDDPISHLCAYLALVPQGLMIAYATLLWSTREIEIAIMLAGQLGCEALNFILKRYIKEERPTQMHGKGYGMPSSHAQFVSYFSIYLTFFLLIRHQPLRPPHASSTHVAAPLWQRALLAITALACAGAVAASRVYLSYHTVKQVVAGVSVGAVCGVGWFLVTGFARELGLVEWVLELGVVRWLRLRDLVVGESLEDAGWERWVLRKERRRDGEGKKVA